MLWQIGRREVAVACCPNPDTPVSSLVTFVLLILGPWDRIPSEVHHQKHLFQTNHNRLARPVDEVVYAGRVDDQVNAPRPSHFRRRAGAASVAPSTAQARPNPNSDRLRKEVLGLIRFPWQKLGYEIVFLGPRPGYRAMTISDRRRIEIYNRPGDSPLLTAYDLAHELGHAFDLDNNTTERRNRWRELRGIDPEEAWFGCNRCPDYNTPAGDFAETFAFLLLGPGNYHSRMALPPTKDQIPALAAFCRIKRSEASTPAQEPDGTGRYRIAQRSLLSRSFALEACALLDRRRMQSSPNQAAAGAPTSTGASNRAPERPGTVINFTPWR